MCKVCFNERKGARANGVQLSRGDEHRTVNGVEKKHCPTCKTWKSVAEYAKCAGRHDGLQGMCKLCFKEARNKYRSSDKGKERETTYAKEHVDEARVRNAKRYLEKKDEIIAKQIKYHLIRYHNDPAYRNRMLVSRRINKILKAKCQRKPGTTMELVGCTKLQLQCHLERQFDEFMTWENQGTWHIDHRIPCAAFDPTNVAEVTAMWHYTNLQPLWGPENIRKGDSCDPGEKATYMRAWRELVV